MPRRWKTPAQQRLELEERAAHYRRAGALILKASLEPTLAQAERDAALVGEMASFDPIRHYATDSPEGAIRSCVICRATARRKELEHDPSCLWLQAVRAMKQRVQIPTDLPDTELLSGPRTWPEST